MADLSNFVITFGASTYTEASSQGIGIAAVRNDTLATLASADNELAPLQVNASGALYIQEGAALDVSAATVTVDLGTNNDVINLGTFAVQEDGAALTALQKLDNIAHAGSDVALVEHVPISGQLDDTATTTVTENQIAPVRITSGRALHVATQGTVTVGSHDVTNAGTFAVQVDAALPAGTNNIGDVDIASLPNEGQQTMANSISVAIASDQDVVATSANQTTMITALQLIDDYVFADDAAFTLTSSKVAAIGAIRDDTLSTLAAVENDVVPLRVSSTGALHVTGGGGGTEYTEDAVAPADPTGGSVLLVREDAPVSIAADADWVAQRATQYGAAYAQIVDSTGNFVDTFGSVETPTNPVNNYQTSASLAAGSAVDLTTPEAASKKLTAVEVWSSVAFRARVYTVDNAVESTDPYAVGGGQGFTSWQWKPPHRNYVTLGATAGLDAFRVEVTNLDDNLAADVYATFHYED